MGWEQGWWDVEAAVQGLTLEDVQVSWGPRQPSRFNGILWALGLDLSCCVNGPCVFTSLVPPSLSPVTGS